MNPGEAVAGGEAPEEKVLSWVQTKMIFEKCLYLKCVKLNLKLTQV
jgi:hypothetical protein